MHARAGAADREEGDGGGGVRLLLERPLELVDLKLLALLPLLLLRAALLIGRELLALPQGNRRRLRRGVHLARRIHRRRAFLEREAQNTILHRLARQLGRLGRLGADRAGVAVRHEALLHRAHQREHVRVRLELQQLAPRLELVGERGVVRGRNVLHGAPRHLELERERAAPARGRLELLQLLERARPVLADEGAFLSEAGLHHEALGELRWQRGAVLASLLYLEPELADGLDLGIGQRLGREAGAAELLREPLAEVGLDEDERARPQQRPPPQGLRHGGGLRPSQQLVELGVLYRARAVRVEGVEECVNLGARCLHAQCGDGLAELLLGDVAVAVLVPLLEEVDDAHGVLGEDLAQLHRIDGALLLGQRAGERLLRATFGPALAQGVLRLALHAEGAALAGGRVELHVRAAAQDGVELVQPNLARAVGVPCVEDAVDLLPGEIEADERHGAPELLLGDGAVAVLVPLAEEVDDAHRVLRERVPQLLRHGQVAVLVDVQALVRVRVRVGLGLGVRD
eukprot:scaffold67491_cov66-Phaeocystis_antarctica.AAC.2